MKDDTVYRQAVIELVGDLVKGILSDSATMSMKMSPDYLLENLYKPIRQMPSAQPMCEEVSPDEVLEARNINPASLWPACKLFKYLQKEGYVICKKT